MRMPLERIRALIALAGDAGIERLEIEEDGTRIVILAAAPHPDTPPSPAGAPAGRPAPEPPDASPAAILSPCHGMLHLSPSPGAPPFVSPGDVVRPETPVALVEAMKSFTTIKAGRAGRIGAILAADGGEVETGAMLFALAPEASA